MEHASTAVAQAWHLRCCPEACWWGDERSWEVKMQKPVLPEVCTEDWKAPTAQPIWGTKWKAVLWCNNMESLLRWNNVLGCWRRAIYRWEDLSVNEKRLVAIIQTALTKTPQAELVQQFISHHSGDWQSMTKVLTSAWWGHSCWLADRCPLPVPSSGQLQWGRRFSGVSFHSGNRLVLRSKGFHHPELNICQSPHLLVSSQEGWDFNTEILDEYTLRKKE